MSNSGLQIFSSHAKLMLTGEYLVLKGALSLALPLRFKQQLSVQKIALDQDDCLKENILSKNVFIQNPIPIEENNYPLLHWRSMIRHRLWLEATFRLSDLQIIDTNLPTIAQSLREILGVAKKLNPFFLNNDHSIQVISEMDFDPKWGIGSSSSLISNIAYWADCDPYQINHLLFKGSGYDIACARSVSPIIYQLNNTQPNIRKAIFSPPFHHQLYFIYLNQKQSSSESIQKVNLTKIDANTIYVISDITLRIENTTDLYIFQSLIDKHEEIVSKAIHQNPIKKQRFEDFEGSIKSLGAWGGDFILAASSAPETYIFDYFRDKQLTTIFRYKEIVINNESSI